MSAIGKVATGFSQPWVAKYAVTGGALAFTEAMELARGVDVSIEPNTGSDNIFYANNQEAESDRGKFNGATLNLTVDGLHSTARDFIMGLPEAVDSWTSFDDDQNIPEVAFGCIVRYQSGGEVTYDAIVLPRVSFQQISKAGATQEDSIDWQTQSLTATVKRGEDAKHTWKMEAEGYTTEALALAALKAKLGVTP